MLHLLHEVEILFHHGHEHLLGLFVLLVVLLLLLFLLLMIFLLMLVDVSHHLFAFIAVVQFLKDGFVFF